VLAASEGGETPIADIRRIYARVSPSVRERFAERGWMYVRNFGAGFGLPWQSVFQTTDKTIVEEHCRKNGIEFEWKENDGLRTRAIRPAIHRHPRTGETVWFNHATFFHVTTLEPAVREMLRVEFSEIDLPTNSFYGDGSPIEDAVLEELREIYRSEEVVFPWQKDDVLMLDNMLMAHGRRPYAGERKILVGMAEPYGEAE
jgi:alpha-ketoglutarate-dependent taurine dioxygenase